MQVYMGADHAGFNLKNLLKEYLNSQNLGSAEAAIAGSAAAISGAETEKYHIVDLGVFSNDPSDYPDIAREVSEKVFENKNSLGILICGSGIGMQIAANRRRGIRAVWADKEEIAKLGREHNNANILCLGERVIDSETAKKIADAFLTAKFDPAERHVRRVEKLETLPQGEEITGKDKSDVEC